MGFMEACGFDPEQVLALRHATEWQPDFAYHNEAEDEPAAKIPLAGSDQIRELWRIFELGGQHDGQ